MKIMKKISIIVLALICIGVCSPSRTNAFTLNQVFSGGDNFINSAGNREVFNGNNEKEAVDQIYYVMLAIGIVLAVICGIILGIQFITTGAAGQAKVKEKLIPFAVGAFVVFGAFGIWRLVYNILNQTL